MLLGVLFRVNVYESPLHLVSNKSLFRKASARVVPKMLILTLHLSKTMPKYSKKGINNWEGISEIKAIPKTILNKISKINKNTQPAGEHNAWKYLKSFGEKRFIDYAFYISKPEKLTTDHDVSIFGEGRVDKGSLFIISLRVPLTPIGKRIDHSA